MLNSKEKNRLREVFQTFPDIKAVFLFGSAASGKRNKLSDLDLGVFTSNPSFRKKKLDLLQKLTEKGFNNVDVVLLDEADLITQYEAIRLNVLIYASDNFDRGATYSRIIRKYLDLKPTLDRQKKAYKQRFIDAPS